MLRVFYFFGTAVALPITNADEPKKAQVTTDSIDLGEIDHNHRGEHT